MVCLGRSSDFTVAISRPNEKRIKCGSGVGFRVVPHYGSHMRIFFVHLS